MKKFLSFLTALTFVTTSVTSTISCQKPKEELTKENVHEKIKEVLSEPLEFNDDWIIDYDQSPDKIKEFVSLLVNTSAWTYLNKTISYLILEKLKTKIPKLFEIFPDFTLSSGVAIDDSSKIVNALLSHKQISFYYDFYYNLNELQNFDFSKWVYLEKGRGFLGTFTGTGGEYNLTYKDGNKFKVNFNHKGLIKNPKKRLDYLTDILNLTPSIKIFNENYQSFALMGSERNGIATVEFREENFPGKDLVERLRNDPKTFTNLKAHIKSNLKECMTNLNYSNVTDLQNVIKKMPTIFNDIDLDIELVKSYLNSDIAKDPVLDYIYGSHITAFPNGMLLLKIKTKLISNGISSTNSINEVVALDINYKESEKD